MMSIHFFSNRTTKRGFTCVFFTGLTCFFHRNALSDRQLPLAKFARWKWLAMGLPGCLAYNSCHFLPARDVVKTLENKGTDSTAQAQIAVEKQPEKIIYLTFDDGPNKGTSNVAAILNREKVPATFFVVGSHVQGSQRQLEVFQNLLANPDFEAANHTYHHAKSAYYLFYKHPEIALADFQQMRDSLQLGNNLSRTPGRNVWRTSEITLDTDKRTANAANLLKANGFTLVGWDVEWKANAKRQLKISPEELVCELEKHFEQRLTQTQNHLVLLLHDQHFADSTNRRALEKLIENLKKTGDYGFRKVSAYPCL